MHQGAKYAGVALAIAVGIAGAASFAAYRAKPKVAPVAKTPPFDLLAYIDGRVLDQENVKDVRCWSSVSKLQMFLAKAPIEAEGRAARIEGYHDLLENLWRDCAGSAVNGEIPEAAVAELLDRRFPKVRDDKGGVNFLGSGDFKGLCILEADIRDYSVTIESWRLMLSWLLRHTDASGRLQLDPTFSQGAAQKLAEFLVVYDHAILRYSRQVALDHKRSTVDGASMAEAFMLQAKLAGGPQEVPK